MKERILIVDDEPDAVEPLSRALQLAGYDVDLVGDGEECLEKVRQTEYHLILLDIMLPRLNGYETLKRLQQNEMTAYIPVIFVTGHFNVDEIVSGLETGAVDAISKPFRIAEVITRAKIRIAEARIKKRFTPVTHFFAEAQEKEHSRRTGVFEFYDKSKTKIGDIFIEDGKVVYATSKDAIKEDAFLQLASLRDATYMFQDDTRPPRKTLSANITSLILEASKILDELESKEIRSETEKRVMIIDRQRIPRILASRTLKANGYAAMVTSSDEITQETIDKYFPDAFIIDHGDFETLSQKLRLTRPNGVVIPIIVYSDADHIEEVAASKTIAGKPVVAVIPKTRIDQSLAQTVTQVIRSQA